MTETERRALRSSSCVLCGHADFCWRTDHAPQAQEIHKPFSDDGVLYCGWATGDQVVDGCGELYPCTTLRTTPNALARAVGPATKALIGCGNCSGLPGNPRCPACKGTGWMPTSTPEPTYTAAEVKVLTEAALRLGRKEAGEEIAAAIADHRCQFKSGSTVETELYVAQEIAQEIASQPSPDASSARTDLSVDTDLPQDSRTAREAL